MTDSPNTTSDTDPLPARTGSVSSRRTTRMAAVVALAAIPVLAAAADDTVTTTETTTTETASSTADTTTTTADTTTTIGGDTTTTADTSTTTTTDTSRRRPPRPQSRRRPRRADTTTTTIAAATPLAAAAAVALPAAPANLRARRSGTTVSLAWKPCPAPKRTRYISPRRVPVRSPSLARGPQPAFTIGNLDAAPATTSCLRRERRWLVANEHHLVVAPMPRPAARPTSAPAGRHHRLRSPGTPCPAPTTYKVYVATSGAGPFTVAGTWSSPAFTVGNLDVGTRYYVRVSAGNAAGWSPTSTTLVVPGASRCAGQPEGPALGGQHLVGVGRRRRERASTSSTWRHRPQARTRS